MNEELPIPSTAPVTVGWYLHPIEAQIALSRLEWEGIPAFLHSYEHANLDWPITLALGGIRLQVPPSFAEEAREVLAVQNPEPEDLDEEVCPKCGSTEIAKNSFSWRVAFLIVHFLHIPLPFRRDTEICRSCNHIWH